MDDPNITIEEYIRLEEEKARRRGRTFNWQTTTFGKLENYEDEDDCFIDFETEFPAIVFDNTLTALQFEATVCPPNKNMIDFIISLDESDDEDNMVIFDENSFSYKIVSVNDIKMNSENDNNEIPSSPNPTIDYFDDLDFFKDFKHEFLAIVYNNGQTSKSDYLIEPIVNPKHIDEFNLNDKTSLSEYDEENDSHFNDLFNINHPDDSKSIKDNDDNNIDIIQSSKGTIWRILGFGIRRIDPCIDLDETMIWGMWDRRVSIGHTSNANSGLSILEPLMELIIEHCTGKCNHRISNEMGRFKSSYGITLWCMLRHNADTDESSFFYEMCYDVMMMKLLRRKGSADSFLH
ncbi:hypothetical protein Tco_0972461 [Tanacetum coccineum]